MVESLVSEYDNEGMFNGSDEEERSALEMVPLSVIKNLTTANSSFLDKTYTSTETISSET
jgi:hypothetical protein